MLMGEKGAEYLPNAILINEKEFQREQPIEVLKKHPLWSLAFLSLFELG